MGKGDQIFVGKRINPRDLNECPVEGSVVFFNEIKDVSPDWVDHLTVISHARSPLFVGVTVAVKIFQLFADVLFGQTPFFGIVWSRDVNDRWRECRSPWLLCRHRRRIVHTVLVVSHVEHPKVSSERHVGLWLCCVGRRSVLSSMYVCTKSTRVSSIV